MARKHLNIGGKIQARRKAMGLSQEDLAQLTGVSRQSVTKWETGQSAPDLDRLVEVADVLGVSLDFLLREPQQVCSSSSSPSLAVADSPSFAEDSSPDASGVPRGIDSSLNGMAPAVAVERVASRGRVPVARFGREADGLLGITKLSSAPLSGISERSFGLPETLPLESASPHEPTSPLRLARSDDSGFHGSDLRPLLRRAAAICGIVLFMIGGLGLLALWALSQMYPVQLADWDGSRHTGLWGFLLAHEIRSLFWLASGLLASGGVLAVGAWRAR